MSYYCGLLDRQPIFRKLYGTLFGESMKQKIVERISTCTLWLALAMLSGVVVQPSIADQFYKTVDKNGNTIYTNVVPPSDVKVEAIQSEKIEKKGTQNDSQNTITNRPKPIDEAQEEYNKSLILGYSKESKLHLYAGQGDLIEVKSVISRGSGVNDKTESGQYTPLHMASIGGHADVIKYLLSVGAKINEKNSHTVTGETALHLAARAHQDSAVEALLNSQANIEAKNDEGRTPLFYADNLYVANLLLSKGANINARDNKGRTPIFIAKSELVSFYIGKGADTNIKDNDGLTVYDSHVKDGQRSSIEKAFKEHGKEGTSKISSADEAFGLVEELVIGNKSDNLTELEAIFARHSNLASSLNSTSNKWGDTILHRSVSLGFVKATELLISKGIKIDRKNSKGETPLHHATNIKVIKVLLGAGASVNARDQAGMTPLHHLAKYLRPTSKDCIIELINGRANLNIRDNLSRTPYDVGLENKNSDKNALQLLKI